MNCLPVQFDTFNNIDLQNLFNPIIKLRIDSPYRLRSLNTKIEHDPS